MKRVLFIVLAACAALAACSEKPQTNAHGVKFDATPWSGTGTKTDTGTVFTAGEWAVGDKSSWVAQLKARTQRGQNEYNREN